MIAAARMAALCGFRYVVAFVIGFLVTYALAERAGAHSGYSTPISWYELRFEQRVNNYRMADGAHPLISSVATHLAGIAISQANWREGRWSTRIGGVPFQVWNEPFFGKRFSAMMKTIRCYGRSFTPRQALWKLTHDGPNFGVYRQVLRMDLWTYGSARAVSVHSHKGWYRGRGRCTAYYFVLAE